MHLLDEGDDLPVLVDGGDRLGRGVFGAAQVEEAVVDVSGVTV